MYEGRVRRTLEGTKRASNKGLRKRWRLPPTKTQEKIENENCGRNLRPPSPPKKEWWQGKWGGREGEGSNGEDARLRPMVDLGQIDFGQFDSGQFDSNST